MTGCENGGRAAAAPDVAGGPNIETQEWNQPTTRCAMDPMVEAMQLTESVEESRDNMGPLVRVEEHQVDNATDMEGDDVRVEEVEAEGQLMITQTALAQKQRQSKHEGTRKGGWVYESGGKDMGSEYLPPEEVTLTTTPPSDPKSTKKLRVEREESPPGRRKIRTRTRTTITSTQ